VLKDESAWCVADARMTIRAAVEDDAQAFFDYRSDPRTQRFVSRLTASPQEAREQIDSQRADEHAVRSAIEVDGRVVGDIGGSFRRPGSLGDAPDLWDFQIGYCVDPEMWGRGIATTAVGLFTSLLHETFCVRRIVGMVFEDNRASSRVLLKNGYRLEGTEIAAVLDRDGVWLNDCRFAHLAGDGVDRGLEGQHA